MRRKKYEDEYDQQYAGYVGDFDDYDSAFSEKAAAETHAQQIQQRNQKKKKRRKRNFAILIVLLLALMVGEFTILMKKWVSPPDLNSALSDGNLDDDIVPNNVEGRKPGCYTFLIAGKDKAAGLTDTVLVGMLDTENGALRFISIPRDTAVNISWAPKKINQYYPAAENRGEDGVEALIAGVEKIVGYRVDSYAIFDVDVFVDLVETMGGVEFDVPIDMDYEDPGQDLYIHVKKGFQKLNGYDTMGVFRYRKSYADGDIGRLNVQHDLLKAMTKQLLTLGNVPNIKKLVDIYEKNVITDLSAGNVMFYVQEFLKLKDENITFETIPANYNGSKNGMSYVFIHLDEWLTYVNTYLNPYTSEVTANNVDIIYQDANGNVVSTTGTIAGNNRW